MIHSGIEKNYPFNKYGEIKIHKQIEIKVLLLEKIRIYTIHLYY